MSNWKKIIVSGSQAHLSSVTASNGSIISGSLTISGSINNPNNLDFNTTPPQSLISSVAGRLSWDNGTRDLVVGTGNNVDIHVGQQEWAYVYNAEATTLNKGEVVFISGSQGNTIAVKRANDSGDPTSAGTLGIVGESIASGAEGLVLVNGLMRKLDTSTLTAGSLLYLSSTPGAYTQTIPTPPSHSVRIGYVAKVDATQGEIYVKVDNGYEIGELHDIIDGTTTTSYGDLLVKSGSVWKNSKQLTGSYGLTGSLQATSITGSSFTGSFTGSLQYFLYNVDTNENTNHGISIGSQSYQNYNTGIGIGRNTYNNYNSGVAIGNGSYNNYDSGVGIGVNTYDNYMLGLGIGSNSYGNYSFGIGIGNGSYGNFNYGIGIGADVYSNSYSGIGIGRNAYGNSYEGIGIGRLSYNNYSYGVGIGSYSSTNYAWGVGIGYYSYNNYYSGVGVGRDTTSNTKGDGTVAIGSYSKAERQNEFVTTATSNTTNKAQSIIQKFREKSLASSGGIYQELFTDASSGRLTVFESSLYQFRFQINAIETSTFVCKTWEVIGAIKRNASNTTSIVGTPVYTITSEELSSKNWDVLVDADDTNESLRLRVKHDALNNVIFSATIWATETRI